MTSTIKRYAVLAFLLISGAELAFASPILQVRDYFFTPSEPTAGLPIVWNGDLLDGCGLGFRGPAPNPEGTSTWLVREDDQLHLFIVDSDFRPPCILPPSIPPQFDPFDIGPLEAGEYVLSVYGVDNDTLFPVNISDFAPNFQTSFTVRNGAESIPSLNQWGLLVLALFVLFITAYRIQSSSNSC